MSKTIWQLLDSEDPSSIVLGILLSGLPFFELCHELQKNERDYRFYQSFKSIDFTKITMKRPRNQYHGGLYLKPGIIIATGNENLRDIVRW